MKRLVLTAFTGKDNQSVDINLCLWVVSSMVYLCLMVYSVIINKAPFDPMLFAGGIAAIAVGHGGAQKIKETSEPGG